MSTYARRSSRIVLGGAMVLLAGGAYAALTDATMTIKEATPATRELHDLARRSLPFADRSDFEDAARGLVARPETLTITAADGRVVWDLEPYKRFITPDKPPPESVHPSLWRQSQLNLNYGLYRVTDRIYQVRGYDISNITYVQGDRGWIVFDPLVSTETARAAHGLVTEHLGQRPVMAVIYSHSHVDHYGGVRGIVDESDVKAGRVKVLAPEGFLTHAISEGVLAGAAMSRRAQYMYGDLLPQSPHGAVGVGLGVAVSSGTISLIPPTQSITRTGEAVTIDGVKMVFQMTPNTEAPAEMNTYFPQFKAMWMAENTTHTLHNVLTLRGAQVRDALAWAKHIDETIRLYGEDIQVKFQAHHWPMWDNQRIVDYLEKQRDLYKYIHDQSVHMMNFGDIGTEIAEHLRLPATLDDYWPNRGYYGTVRHDARAVYQRYMGFYTGNPSDLDPLPPAAAARKYVEYMGGEAAVLERAREDYERGEYRWVAEAVRQVVFANPDNTVARGLLADAYEQLGYQAESGPWRSEYLQGAQELRQGVSFEHSVETASPDTLRAMPPELLFDFMAVRLNGARAAMSPLSLDVEFTDLRQRYALRVSNGVLNYRRSERPTPGVDASLALSKATLLRIHAGDASLGDAITAGDLTLKGRREAVETFLGLLDTFPRTFPIVTP